MNWKGKALFAIGVIAVVIIVNGITRLTVVPAFIRSLWNNTSSS